MYKIKIIKYFRIRAYPLKFNVDGGEGQSLLLRVSIARLLVSQANQSFVRAIFEGPDQIYPFFVDSTIKFVRPCVSLSS